MESGGGIRRWRVVVESGGGKWWRSKEVASGGGVRRWQVIKLLKAEMSALSFVVEQQDQTSKAFIDR